MSWNLKNENVILSAENEISLSVHSFCFYKGFLINMYLVYLVREPIQGSCSNYLNKHDVQTSKPHLPRRPISILIVVVGSGFFKFWFPKHHNKLSNLFDLGKYQILWCIQKAILKAGTIFIQNDSILPDCLL